MSVLKGGTRDRIAWLLLCAVASCTSTEVRLPTDAPTDTTSGGVRRTTLKLSVKQSPADSTLTASLGWPATSIPGATVVLRTGSGTLERTVVADGSGEATFTDLLEGIYSVNALRLLSTSEQASLPAAYQEVDALGGSRVVSLGSSPVTVDVQLQSTRRGTLVISELWSGDPAVGNGFYDDGDYLEIYNNSDIAIELTDKLVVEGFQGTFDNPDLNSCALTAPFQRDSLGIWSTMIYAFPPGAPTVPPGGVVLLATDAIDHRRRWHHGARAQLLLVAAGYRHCRPRRHRRAPSAAVERPHVRPGPGHCDSRRYNVGGSEPIVSVVRFAHSSESG
jgi:hypothetical protein